MTTHLIEIKLLPMVVVLLNLAHGASMRNFCAMCVCMLCQFYVCMSKRKKLVVFTAKHRKDLVTDCGKKDYTDVVETAITKIQCGVHLDLFPLPPP